MSQTNKRSLYGVKAKTMETRLAPIENPSSLWMKIVFFITKRKFGKVLSPLKVAYARLPLPFALFANRISELDAKISLHPAMALMVKLHVAQINSCHFCIDIAKSIAIQKFKQTEKFYELNDFRSSNLYSPSERAALLLAEELTVNKAITDDTFENAKRHFTERQLVEIAWLVATEHYYNMINLAFQLESDNLCDISQKKLAH